MAQTHLELVNRILRRLREDTVTSIDDNDYALLIAGFVADAYDEVLDTHPWEACKHQVVITLVQAQDTYNLSKLIADGGAIPADTRLVKEDSELQFLDKDIPQAFIYEAPSDTGGFTPQFVYPEQLRFLRSRDRNEDEDLPSFFTVYPSNVDGEGNMLLEVYPSPSDSTTVTLELWFWTKPDSLEVASTSNGTRLLIPDRPVFELALMYAMNERGEEMGEPGNLAERRYAAALYTAIEKEMQAYARADAYDWRRD